MMCSRLASILPLISAVKKYLYLEQNITSVSMKWLIVLNISSISLYSKSKLAIFSSVRLTDSDRLAEQHGLEIADRQTFKDYFDKHNKSPEGRTLLQTMKALEVSDNPQCVLDVCRLAL
jgi:hypothetical protein